MKKLWNCVYMYGGLISDQKIFWTKEGAEKWFDEIVENNDNWEGVDVEINKTEEYMTYYDGDDRHPVEMSCRLVEVE